MENLICINFYKLKPEHQYIILKCFLDENIQKYINKKECKKIIYIPNKLINFIT
jgi:leucyl-tRNA synthetase